MRLPVFLVATFLGSALIASSGSGQVPDLDRSNTAAEADSPYALPRSAPLRQPLGRAPAAQPSLYAEEPAQPAAQAAAVDESPALAADLPGITPAIGASSTNAPEPNGTTSASTTSSTKTESNQSADRTETSGTKSRDQADGQQKGSGDETVLALELPEFVPQPIRDAWDKLVKVWRYELFMKVTVEKLSIGLILLFISFVAAKRISSWFASRVLGRLGIARNNAATIQTIAYYALMAAFTLSTLGALGVPVTIFSFFGGALAVGIGFGSQNIVNNFISGLILLAERPIRVGDVIQIDGATGKVTEIGARSTRITTGANMEILVPNSTFLQTNVVNWTLSNDVISSKVHVGVAYGSPARQVASLLLKAAQQNTDVLSEPGPGVSFTNFGDHALEFELSFWLRLSDSDRGKIESDLRFAIDDLFAEHGIVIAYPQRDVHLNLLRPVEVRIAPPAGELRRAAA
ncbi:MAG TPA: mechanosensitive ion channel domain-containing protein [Pirellulaceae bacterium]|nr:mechanosensitive ion channel domain-containing protein [Pirellulaceae bacterium]